MGRGGGWGKVGKGEVAFRYRLYIVQKWQDLCLQDL